jgi:ribosomal protein S18 acetylase RimI-like enzyme
MKKVSITVENDPKKADVNELINHLIAYNDTKAETENWKPLNIFIRDENNTILGGLNGYSQWRWLVIDILWVSDELRDQGYGSQLVQLAEAEGKKRLCHHAYVETLDFQALEFYQKNSYTVFAQLENFPLHHTRYYLQKVLE